MEKEKFNRIFDITLRAVLSAAIAGGGVYILCAYGYFSELRYIDNAIGVIPFALVIVFISSSLAVTWMRHKAQFAALSATLCFFAVFSVALVPNALRGNWFPFAKPYPKTGANTDVSAYAPFSPNTLAVKLDEPSELILDGDLPVLDGALALYPVYSAIAQTAYSETAFKQAPESVTFTDTLQAYDGIISGERDVIFVAGAAQSQMQKAKEHGAELVFTPIGKEAFVFLVGKNNPIDDISVRQIRNIYSGKTAKWATLGWREGGNIIAFQRPEGSGSQTGLQQIMGNIPIAAPRPLPDASLVGENSLMKQISVEYKGVQPALGYSYRFFAQTMLYNPDCKILSVDGVAPTNENIKSGAYPFTVRFYAVTNGAPSGNAKRLIDFVVSPQGQKLIEKTGYTAL